MRTSEQINEIAVALAKAQGEMGGAAKSAANPFFKSKYADLASVREACNGPLTKHGIAVVQVPSTAGAVVSVETRLLHISGQWIEGDVSCTAKDDSPQAVGSAITYLRRYALQSFAGIAPEDDDAEAAQGRPKMATVSTPKPVAPPIPDDSYPQWWKELDEAADLGLTTLKATWDKAPKDYKAYALAQQNPAWMALKQRAAQARESAA